MVRSLFFTITILIAVLILLNVMSIAAVKRVLGFDTRILNCVAGVAST